jgi:N-acylglucosamine-6-phosphate 2-epimerase
MDAVKTIAHQLIVSCQAGPEEVLHGSVYMVGMARAAQAGGAGGLRVNGVDDIIAIRRALDLPIIGIEKHKHPQYGILITPDFEAAQRIAQAGADIIALDGTIKREGKEADLRSLIERIHTELHLPVMADVSCLEDAAFAQSAGADLLGTTLAGYTEHGRPALPNPDLDFLRAMVSAIHLPIIAEGRFEQPNEVAQAFTDGAYAVVVGSAITRPQMITQRFVAASQTRSGVQRYFDAVSTVLDVVAACEQSAIQRAADVITQTIVSGGMLYLFGTGHSHMMAEEGHYRAGGLAPVCPILVSGLMLHESAIASTKLERTPGVITAALERYPLAKGDTLIVFSNSGVNAAPVEIAKIAKELGLTLIAVQSNAYSAQTEPGALGKKLEDYADIVINNHLPPGDSMVSLNDAGLKTGAGSTVVGAFILNALLTEVIERLNNSGEIPPILNSPMIKPNKLSRPCPSR